MTTSQHTRTEHAGAPEIAVRPVTDDEVAFYREHGWVTLPGLIDPDSAQLLFERARRFMGGDGDGHDPRPGQDLARIFFQVYNEPTHDDELFAALVHGGQLGHNAARLLGRDTEVRVLDENIAVKLPADKGDPPTALHQDGPYLPFDRMSVNFWIALDDVTVEMGLLRFRDGSHRFGPLGRVLFKTDADLERAWPEMADCPTAQPPAMRPGDATAHSSLTVHSAPENSTDRARWTYLLTCYPGDALRTIRHRRTDGLDLGELVPVAHDRFPVIHTPAG